MNKNELENIVLLLCLYCFTDRSDHTIPINTPRSYRAEKGGGGKED